MRPHENQFTGGWGNTNGIQPGPGQGGVSVINNSSILSTGMQQGTPSHAPFGKFPAANSVGTFDPQFQMYQQTQLNQHNQFNVPQSQFAPQLNQQQLTAVQQQQILAQRQMLAAQVCAVHV